VLGSVVLVPRYGHSPRLLVTAVRWPVGLVLTSFAYVWRTTPLHRVEVEGTMERDGGPQMPDGVSWEDVQWPSEGSGAFLHRRYRTDIVDAQMEAAVLMEQIRANINRVVPGGIAHFKKVEGDEDGPLMPGDVYVVRMPGPWDGPVRVMEVTPTSFRFATLEGHLEAGQIEWRARDEDGALCFEVESWSRPGDRMSEIAHHKLRMAKEVQLHMWTSVIERVAKLVQGRMRAGVDIDTAVVDL
jgi:hypothetical protein